MAIPQQESWKILLIGDSCKDIYHYGVCERISPEAPVPVLKQIKVEKKEGMSSNVKLNLESFGLDVLHFHNLEIIKKHRFVDSRYNQHLLRLDEGEDMKIEPFNVGVLSDLSRFDAVVISDYNKGFLPNKAVSRICELFKDKPVFVDSKKQDLSFFSDCIIKINEKEFNSLTSMPKNSKFVVTLGEKGAMCDGKIYSTDKTEVFDVCGAGDVFLSGLVYGWLRWKDPRLSIDLANKSARVSVSKMGTHVLTKEDVIGLCI
tara:strand:+ start:874 stop:1653 length:780 start_codon:yes stop_codon:yes gene_type:complete